MEKPAGYSRVELLPGKRTPVTAGKVKPEAGESKDDYMGRCIPAMIDEGKPQDQAVAMCGSMYDEDSKRRKSEKEWADKFDATLKACKPKEPKEPKKPKK